MRWLLILVCCGALACASISKPAELNPIQPARLTPYVPDESNPGLVKAYMMLPCRLLSDSATFQLSMVKHMEEHFEECTELAKTSDYIYTEVMCGYVGMQWKFIYVNQKSVEKAFNLMCREDGTRRSPEYEIHF